MLTETLLSTLKYIASHYEVHKKL